MNPLETIFHAVVDTTWRASCLILLVLGLRWWVRGHVSARLLFWVWIAVALRLLLPVSVPTTWSPFNMGSSLDLGYGPVSSVLDHSARFEVTAPKVTGAETAASLAPIPPNRASTSLDWMALVWSTGVAALLLTRILACVRFAGRLRRSGVAPGHAAEALLEEASRSLDMGGVKVLVTDAVSGPALYGAFSPRILFPPGFVEKLTLSEIRLTLAHELAHARRRDLLADAFIHLTVVVHWFNPLVWLATRVARQDCELACDESVLCRVADIERESYGATLLRLARLTAATPKPGFTLAVVASRAQIKRRIQMIIAHKSFPLSSTILGCTVCAALTALSFTSELIAQPARLSDAAAPLRSNSPASGESEPSNIVYDPSVDRLDVLFPTGIVATVGDRSITIADVRRHVAPLIPKLQRDVRTQEEFNGKLTLLQNSAVKELVARALLIRQFHDQKEGEQAKQIPAEYIDTSIADRIAEQFEGDRSKFLAFLKERGETQREYRKTVEEDIIYNYMRSQERKVAGIVTKRVPETETRPIRLRIIQLTRAEGETDVALLAKANTILARFRVGESFDNLAREFDQSGKRDQGGDWGWLGATDVRSEFREAFLALKKGEVSAPLLSEQACLLLYAEDRR
jgi:peptidyl-prolyl cis-trans isomerase SurA